MCQVDIKNGDTRIDPCMRNIVMELNKRGINIVMCCCGHKKYSMTILVENYFPDSCIVELFSGLKFPKSKKKFYKRDRLGRYFIPEVENEHNKNNN